MFPKLFSAEIFSFPTFRKLNLFTSFACQTIPLTNLYIILAKVPLIPNLKLTVFKIILQKRLSNCVDPNQVFPLVNSIPNFFLFKEFQKKNPKSLRSLIPVEDIQNFSQKIRGTVKVQEFIG